MDAVEQLVVKLFEQNYGLLFRYTFRLVGRTEQAEDIIQESFLRLCTALFQGKRIDNPHGWMLQTSHNLAIDCLRMQRRELLDNNAGTVLDFASTPNCEEADLIERERMEQVRETVRTLPERERAALLLRCRGLSYKEVAQVLDISINSVGPTLAHGLRKLKNAYKQKKG